MGVRYITVTPITNLFLPATMSFSDIAIIGAVDSDAKGPKKFPIAVTDPTAISQSTVSIATSAATATTSATLTFSAVPSSIVAGMTVADATNAGAIAANSVVTSTTSTTVVLNQNATGPGVTSGDTIQFTNPNNGRAVDDLAWFKGALSSSIKTSFGQSPGPTKVWAIATDPANDGAKAVTNALDLAAKIAAQIIVIASTPLMSATQGKAEIEALAAHCNTVSNAGDGMERIGIAMLGNGVTDTTLITGTMAQNRMTMIAHHSTQDAAAAMAGVVAGYQPHISLLLKPIALSMDKTFSSSEIDAFNAARVNWVTQTPLIPGAGYYMGEGYTLGADQPYVDIVRTIDEITFDLKAALIRSIGELRVTRAGLRALVSEMTAVLQPLQDQGVVDSFIVYFPLLTLLDKNPASLTDVELQEIHNAQASRTVASIVTIEYAGAIHRLNITLKFE
jgi:hypothetical protein